MRYFITGGAGFIGSHLSRHLLSLGAEVIIYDNLSSGRRWHLRECLNHPSFSFIEGDLKDLDLLCGALRGVDIVYHFASNPDISKAVQQPDIDFWAGTYLTNNVLEAMRIGGVSSLIYASGSGVYGDVGLEPIPENYSEMRPVSTYGASKLACEALICSYCHMFDMKAAAFRFANVVGPNQTHGVGYDFILRLMKEPQTLNILGDGSQDKSYIYVDDVIRAMRVVETDKLEGYNVYNVNTPDSLTVTQIAQMAVEVLALTSVEFRYAGGNRGWKGDVPIIKLDSAKIRSLGWVNQYSSKEAMYKSLESIHEDAALHKFDY